MKVSSYRHYYYMPGTVVSILHILTHLTLKNPMKQILLLSSSKKKNEGTAEKECNNLSKGTQLGVEPGFEYRQFGSRVWLCCLKSQIWAAVRNIMQKENFHSD